LRNYRRPILILIQIPFTQATNPFKSNPEEIITLKLINPETIDVILSYLQKLLLAVID
jgi:hypothetical protein